MPALLGVADKLMDPAKVQVIATTHSPLIMASLEPLFDADKDVWFDLDMVRKKVVLTRRDFEKHGDIESWLMSEAFDLASGRSLDYETLLKQAAQLLEQESPSLLAINKMNAALVSALNPKDDFLFRWRYICKQKGWLA